MPLPNADVSELLIALEQRFPQHVIEHVGGFENEVFRMRRAGGDHILRLTELTHRSAGQLQAEIDFVEHLHTHALPVARPLVLPSGAFVEPVELETRQVLLTRFEAAPGAPAARDQPEVWNEALFEQWGGVLARMHLASATFAPPPGAPRRHAWHEDDLVDFERHLPAHERDLIDACQRVVAAVRALPHTPETHALVHGDLHPGNFVVHEGRMTVFDFDDASYHGLAHDLAMALYYASWPRVVGAEAMEEPFFQGVLRGYERHRPLPPGALEQIPLYLRLRDALLISSIHKKFDLRALPAPIEALYSARRHRLLEP